MGKALGQPVYKLLGGMGRERVHAYASSIAWASDEVAVAQTSAALAQGFDLIKVKIGGAAGRGDRALPADPRDRSGRPCGSPPTPTGRSTVDDAVKVARALLELDYYWFEEPIVPEDLDGYRRLRASVPMRFTAGESEHTAVGARDLIAARAVGIVQPDVARSGGISETRNIAALADAFHVGYAPHVGASGAVCAAASLHLAAAMPNFVTFECMTFRNPLRERLTTVKVADPDALVDGTVAVPQGDGPRHRARLRRRGQVSRPVMSGGAAPRARADAGAGARAARTVPVPAVALRRLALPHRRHAGQDGELRGACQLRAAARRSGVLERVLEHVRASSTSSSTASCCSASASPSCSPAGLPWPKLDARDRDRAVRDERGGHGRDVEDDVRSRRGHRQLRA